MERDRTFPPPVIRWSELKHMGRSPAHFRAAYTDPTESNPAMLFGSLVHRILLGGDDKLAVWEGDRRAGKLWDAFEAEHKGKLIVKANEYSAAELVAQAVIRDPVAGPLIVGLQELELAATMNGRKCAGRLDVVRRKRITELKTTTCSEPLWFQRHAIRMGYHGQAAFYLDLARAAGHTIEGVDMIAVEIKPPYAVTVLTPSERTLEEGRKLVRIWMEREAVCESSNDWPTYAQSPVPFDVAEDALELVMPDGEVIAA